MRRAGVAALILTMCVLASSVAWAQGAKADTRARVLDTAGAWRVFETLSPPVIEADGGPKALLFGKTWLETPTPMPPAAWMAADFDDAAWLRGSARIAHDTPYRSRLFLRGKFTVTDPARVKDLAVDVDCYGGAVVYLNGVPIARAHYPVGAALADGYPDEAFVDEQGRNVGETSLDKRPTAETQRRFALRTRTLAARIPAAALKPGVNVLAIEIARAPYGRVMERFRDVFDHPSVKRMLGTKELPTFVELKWATCSVRRVELTAAGADGLVPNAARPKGFAVWNSDVMASDYDLDFGSSAEALRPIDIVAARGGSFSGKVMAGSDRAIKGLRASASDLRGPSVIPAAAVRIRYGFAWGEDASAASLYPVKPALLGALAETPPAEVPVREAPPRRASDPIPAASLFGAVASVWATVDIPESAAPGRYEGTLTVRADGAPPVAVPLRLTVEDYTLPPPQEYRTWVELIESPDTLVEEYGVPRWSDRHFELIGRAMDHLNRIGSRVVYIPVIERANLGNEESMVRWIKKADGTYSWDFSIMERYLDLAEKRMGRPKVVCFWAWEKFMQPTVENPSTYEGDRPTTRKDDNPGGTTAEIRDYVGKGPRVTVLDPATGKTESVFLPYILDPASKGLWKPLFDELRARMKRRGLEGVMMIGTPSDITLRKEHFAFYSEVAPGIPWVSQSHMNHTRIFEAGGAKLGYHATVFDVGFAIDPDEGRRHGWQTPDLHAHLLRNWGLDTDYFPLATWRHMTELNIAGNQRGIGHLGADFWSVVKSKRGTRMGRIYEKYPECNWRSNDVCTSLLAPGPDGPVATVRYEMLREGVEECEARIAIEKALTNPALRAKLGDALATRCQAALDERTRAMIRGISTLELTGYWRALAPLATHPSGGWWNKPGVAGNAWFISSNWQSRTRELYSLAGQVARALAAK